jgi:hypothetical protein
MDMIWHDHVRIQRHVGNMLWNVSPTLHPNLPVRVQSHLAAHDLAEQALVAMRANRNEIRAGRCVVVPAKADRMSMVLERVVPHGAHDTRRTR